MIEQREPAHRGEREVKSLLDNFSSPDLTYWFALDYLPEVSDLDLLLFERNAGLFAIEIKAIPITEIKSISLTRIEIKGRGSKCNPNKQAYEALVALMEYSRNKGVSLPFMVATTMWPKISRHEWNSWFSNHSEILQISDSMIFEEDLISHSRLVERLKFIYRNPPIRRGSFQDYKYEMSHREELAYLLDRADVIPTRPSISRFETIAQTQRNSLLKRYPLNKKCKILFEGIPGSGKTYSLLTLAQQWGTEGYPVLFLCYNKALAAQIRVWVKSIAHEIGDDELAEFIQVMDIYQHAKNISDILGIEGINADDYNDWLALMLEEITRNRLQESDFPDLLLVDEVQDFNDVQIEWIKFWSQRSQWVAISRGFGQELYDSQLSAGRYNWLDSFQIEKLTTNYRNPGKLFVLSDLMCNSNLSSKNVNDAETLIKRKLKNKTLKVNRPKEIGLSLVVVDDNTEQSLIDEYYYKIAETLQAFAEADVEPFQLLILVRGKSDRRRCLSALEQVKRNQGVSFLDLTDDRCKRNSPRSDQIRLCTYESSRGLEAEVVLLLSFEQLIEENRKDANLAHVVLSRAINKCIIVLKKERSQGLQPLFERFMISVEKIANDSL